MLIHSDLPSFLTPSSQAVLTKLPRVLWDSPDSGYEMIKPLRVHVYWYDALNRGNLPRSLRFRTLYLHVSSKDLRGALAIFTCNFLVVFLKRDSQNRISLRPHKNRNYLDLFVSFERWEQKERVKSILAWTSSHSYLSRNEVFKVFLSSGV